MQTQAAASLGAGLHTVHCAQPASSAEGAVDSAAAVALPDNNKPAQNSPDEQGNTQYSAALSSNQPKSQGSNLVDTVSHLPSSHANASFAEYCPASAARQQTHPVSSRAAVAAEQHLGQTESVVADPGAAENGTRSGEAGAVTQLDLELPAQLAEPESHETGQAVAQDVVRGRMVRYAPNAACWLLTCAVPCCAPRPACSQLNQPAPEQKHTHTRPLPCTMGQLQQQAAVQGANG